MVGADRPHASARAAPPNAERLRTPARARSHHRPVSDHGSDRDLGDETGAHRLGGGGRARGHRGAAGPEGLEVYAPLGHPLTGAARNLNTRCGWVLPAHAPPHNVKGGPPPYAPT